MGVAGLIFRGDLFVRNIVGYNAGMRARVMIAAVLAVLPAFSAAAETRTQKNFLTLAEGVHFHFVSGSADEYVLGENDFPVVPAHAGFAFSFSYLRLGKALGWEIGARYVSSARVDLEDPSDGDIVQVTAGPHASLTLNLLYAPWTGSVRPYVVAGGGADIFLGRGAVYTSRYGYEIEFPEPSFKERLDPEAHVGLGLLLQIGKSWGCRLESRFGWIFEESRTLSDFSAVGGLYLSF